MIVSRNVTVRYEYGICARPAAFLVALVNSRGEGHEVTFERDGMQVSGREIMGLLTMEACDGAELAVTVDGPDAETVMCLIEELFQSGFDDDVFRRIRQKPPAP
jgi:phosphotransferase system HPr (HPr) family protein